MVDKNTQNPDFAPGQATSDAHDALGENKQEYASGSAMLNAEAQVNQQPPEDDAFEQPTTTNIDKEDDAGSPENYRTSGAYPADQQELKRDEMS
jgi:hypothetical protein